MRCLFLTTLLALSLPIGGCMNYYVIPDSMDKEIDRTATFADLKRDPEAHKGKTVALGGVVLQARNTKDGTLIEVLQLPLDGSDRPDYPLEASQGRFIALDPEHHDPFVLKNRRITLVGDVLGKKVEPLDELEYAFPYLSARFIYIWPEGRRRAYFRSYPYYGYPEPYPYWYPPYGYYGPPVILSPTTPPRERRFEAPSDKESSPSQSPDGNSKRRFENKPSD